MSGNKRSRKSTKGASSSQMDDEPNWGTSRHLSQVRSSWQPILYRNKILQNKSPYCYERHVPRRDWEAFGVVEPFRRWGWLAALQPINVKLYTEKQVQAVYPEAVLEWISTLVRVEGEQPPFTTTLTGTVSGKSITLSMDSFNELAGNVNEYDSGVTIENVDYSYPSAVALFENGPNTDQWYPMLRSLFNIEGDIRYYKLRRDDLVPLARVLSIIINFNILPRKSDVAAIRNYEVPLLYALMTGTPALSLRHIMMMNIWESREVKDRTATVPYVRFLSALLHKGGVIPGRMKPRHESLQRVKKRVKGLYMKNVGQTFFMQDLAKGLTFQFDGGDHNREDSDEEYEEVESEEEGTEMEVDQGHGQRRGKASQREPDEAWARNQFEQQLWTRQEEHFNMMQDGQKAQFWMQEYYRHQDWEQSERIRHYQDLVADRPAVPEYTPIDYSRMQRPHEMSSPQEFTPPPYPGIPPPMFYRPPPARDGQGASSQSQAASPWDMAPLAQGLYESLFSYPPSGPQ